MSSVRSRRVFGPVAITAAAGITTLYTVPALRTLILRSLVFTDISNLAGAAVLWVNGVQWEVIDTPANRSGRRDDVHWILNPGDVLRVTIYGGTTDCYGAGSLLDGAPS